MVITSTIQITNDLTYIKIDNIKNIFFNNILIQNDIGILNSDNNAVDYANALVLRNLFLKTIENVEYTNLTLDGDNDINYYLTKLASNDIKKYVFLTDVTADYYKTKEDNADEISDYNYLHKLKFLCGDSNCNDITITTDIENIEYNNINNIQNTNSETFNYLFNNIIINNNDFNTNVYGIFHYKYKKNEFRFYTALINYNILLAYYYYINDNNNDFKTDFKNKIVNQISTKIIEFKYLFNTYKGLLEKAKQIITDTSVKNDLSESDKIRNFNVINDKLIEINENIENKRDRDIMFKDNININIKDKIKTITIFIYYTIITFFLLNVILFNYYSVETNKFLSIVVTIFLIFIYFVLKLFKNEYYEYFEGTPGGTPPGGTPPGGTPPGGTPPGGTPPGGTPPGGTPPGGTPPAGTPPAGTPPGDTPPAPVQTSSVSEYRIDQEHYESLMGTSTFVPQDLDYTNPDSGDVTIIRKSIADYFSTFSGCQNSVDENCIQTAISNMFATYEGLEKGNVGGLLQSISDSGTKIASLIENIGEIQNDIDSTKALIELYTGDSGIIKQLQEDLTTAEAERLRLETLNGHLSDLYSALYTKNDEIDIEINRLKGLINDNIKPNILGYARRIRETIINKGNKQEEIDDLEKEINRIETQINSLDEINQKIEEAKTIIDTNISQLNANIVSTLDNLLSYREEYNDRSKEIAEFRIQMTDQSTEEQKAARDIIGRYDGEKTKLEKEKSDIESRIETLSSQKTKLEAKIENIQNIQNKKTYTYNVRIIDVIKIESNTFEGDFNNILENDIAYLLELPQNRIIVENAQKATIDNENYINFDLKILPSPSYLKLEEHIKKILRLKNILQTLFIELPSEDKTKLLNTIYAKYIVYINLDTSRVTDDTKPKYTIKNALGGQDTEQLPDELLNYGTSEIDELKTLIKDNKIGLISNNIIEIKGILNIIFGFLNIEYNESTNYKTYYDEVHPNLVNELAKYEKIDNNNNLYDYIIESKLNTTEHDLLYFNALNKFFIHLSIYLGIFYIYVSHFNYFGYTINFLITIIVLLILLYYLFKDINKKVRRDSKKNYWKYSNNYFKNK